MGCGAASHRRLSLRSSPHDTFPPRLLRRYDLWPAALQPLCDGERLMNAIQRQITERRGLHGLLQPIEGYVYDDLFAVHQSKEVFGHAWCITHLPTGYILSTYPTKRQAEEIIATLLTLPVPWKTRSPQVLRRYRTIIFTVLRPPVPVA